MRVRRDPSALRREPHRRDPEGTVGDTTNDFAGTWWFEYRNRNTVLETPHLAFSVAGNTQEHVSSAVSDLDQLDEPIDGTQRVRWMHYRTCVEGASPPYGPLCSPERGFLTGDYVVGSLAFWNGASSATGSIAVESGPDGASPAGTVSIDFYIGDEPDVDGPITCLALETVERPGRTPMVYASMVVDNTQGDDAVVRLHQREETYGIQTFIEFDDPPADRTQCPDPEATVGSPYGSLVGFPLRFGDGPSGYSGFGDVF